MHRRLFSNWALWLLPVLALRAFLPVGFMLSGGAGGFSLGFCPVQAPAEARFVQALSAAADASAHAATHAHHHGSAHAGSAQHTPVLDGPVQDSPGQDSPVPDNLGHEAGNLLASCPFALAAAVALTQAAQNELVAIGPRAARFIHPPTVVASSAHARTHPIRGPPILS